MAEFDLEKVNQRAYEDTESKFKDKLYNSLIDRYTAKGRQFKFSDRFVWKGAIYALPEMLSYIVFFAIFLWLGHLSLNRFGEFRTLLFFILLVVWRLNIQIKLLRTVSSKLS